MISITGTLRIRANTATPLALPPFWGLSTARVRPLAFEACCDEPLLDVVELPPPPPPLNTPAIASTPTRTRTPAPARPAITCRWPRVRSEATSPKGRRFGPAAVGWAAAAGAGPLAAGCLAFAGAESAPGRSGRSAPGTSSRSWVASCSARSRVPESF